MSSGVGDTKKFSREVISTTSILSGFVVKAIKNCFDQCTSIDEESGVKNVNPENLIDSLLKQFSIPIGSKTSQYLSDSVLKIASQGNLKLEEISNVFVQIVHETTNWGNFNIKPSSPIGFHSFELQLQDFTIKRGIELNIMVVGRSGIGKSTAIDSLFRNKLSRVHYDPSDCHSIPKTTEISTITHIIEEERYRMRLSITDTPGFGDQLSNDNHWCHLVDYINFQHSEYFKEENSPQRRPIIPDSRIHCCLYFITPTGHRLSKIDLAALENLSGKVNLIPLIGRSDSLTPEEIQAFKKRINQDLEKNSIKYFPKHRFSYSFEDISSKIFDELQDKIPLALVGSNDVQDVDGFQKLIRKTPFGTIQMDNPDHCDFSLLEDALIKKHFFSLIDTTHHLFYEEYRKNVLLNKF